MCHDRSDLELVRQTHQQGTYLAFVLSGQAVVSGQEDEEEAHVYHLYYLFVASLRALSNS